MDFAVNGLEAGTRGSELQIERPAAVRVTARAACLLPDTRKESGPLDPDKQPFWSPEHARVGGSRDVTVDVVVNGRVAISRAITADGALRDLTFDIPIERSSWVALRILGSAHTNPIFILVGGRPIRASKDSAEWCLKAVDQCWSQKSSRMRRAEVDSAQRAYDHARTRYRQLVSESQV
jgi:hypothetical protein